MQSSLLTKIHFNYFYIIILVLALIIRLVYLSYTDFHTRTHDAEAHLEYVAYIVKEHKLPSPDLCWECWQPPLYYVSAAGFLTIIGLASETLMGNTLQYINVFLDMLFILYSILIFKLLIKKKSLTYLAVTLFIFWPSHIIHSVRIGNDMLFYLLSAMSLFYALKWNSKWHKYELLVLSLVCAVLALLTKTNGLIMITVIFLTYLTHHVVIKKFSLPLLLIISVILLIGIQIIMQKNNIDIVHNSNGLNNKLRVGNTLNNFTMLSPHQFIQNPFTNAWSDEAGRQSFLTYLGKTSLFGEFQFENVLQQILALEMQVFFLILCTAILISHALFARSINKDAFLLLSYLIFSLFSLALLRFKYPYASSNDFRYIFPVLIPFVYFYIQSIHLYQKKRLFFIGHVLFAGGIIFSLLSIVFFLIPVFIAP